MQKDTLKQVFPMQSVGRIMLEQISTLQPIKDLMLQEVEMSPRKVQPKENTCCNRLLARVMLMERAAHAWFSGRTCDPREDPHGRNLFPEDCNSFPRTHVGTVLEELQPVEMMPQQRTFSYGRSPTLEQGRA